MSVLRGLRRPRNDEHIITPNHSFEPLRTAYNRKNHSNLKGSSNNYSMLILKVTHTISPQAFHNRITASR
jgi:hypothetical protein